MQKKNRNHSCKIRLTTEELQFFKEKSLSYGSISVMMRRAVEALDDRKLKSKIDLLDEFSSLLNSYDVNFSHIAGNLNQVVKRANQLSIGKELSISFFEEQLYPRIVEVHKEIIAIRKLQQSIFRQILNMK